ncbi:phiSA1p31-related protein [Streptomyces sp. NPDC058272]|uniref:phiSA1p31-related protein n=1 Tax=Streptomyces sp. NPDC058272 TaxID=3346415 RepID=UPI0036F01510
MESTFKAGDKVEHRSFGAGQVVYGPFKRMGRPDFYLMEQASNGEHRTVEPDALTKAAKFKVGDVAKGRLTGRTLKILAGPYSGRRVDAGEWYVVEYPEGHQGTENVRGLLVPEPAPEVSSSIADESLKVGDKARVLKDDPIICTGAYVGKVGTVLKVGGCARKPLEYRLDFGDGDVWWVESVERVDDADTYTYNGVTYDLSAKYKDTDGDIWKFERIGYEVRGTYTSRSVEEYDETLAGVVRSYGPLTRA